MANADIPAPSPNQTPSSPNLFDQRWPRVILVLVIALGIVGITYAVGQRNGWNTIGSGGVNAQLLPKVGEPAPDLFTFTADGTPVLLSQLKGQPVWLNFWGSWCEPCQAEFPAVEAAYTTLNAEGVIMLGISQREDVSESVAYAQAAGGTFPVLWDPTRVLSLLDEATMSDSVRAIAEDTKSWQINNFPTHIFIDRNGIVQAVVIKQMTEEEAVAYGEQILAIPYTGEDPAGDASALGATPSASPEATPAP